MGRERCGGCGDEAVGRLGFELRRIGGSGRELEPFAGSDRIDLNVNELVMKKKPWNLFLSLFWLKKECAKEIWREL